MAQMEEILESWLDTNTPTQTLTTITGRAFTDTDTNCINIDWIETAGKILKQVLERSKTKKIPRDEKRELKECHDEGLMKVSLVVRLSDDVALRQAALTLLFDLLPHQAHLTPALFPLQHFTEALRNIVLITGPISDLLEVVKAYLKYEDVAWNLWNTLDTLVRHPTLSLSDKVVENVVRIIDANQKFPSSPATIKKSVDDQNSSDSETSQCLVSSRAIGGNKPLSASVKNLWDRLMICQLKPSTKQMLVVALIEHMMPRLQKPIFLTDYFMDCLNQGGAISLLGLQGIFVLVQKHNINYPNVYTKLYSLLSPDIFSTAYKSRFFYLSDIFLSSSHLPEAMIAGFVKRLARLALVAPPTDIVLIMAFITNLLIRHPGLKKLINRARPQTDTDPYLFDEPDPSASCAIDSSLWEVELLKHHILPSVAASAMFIDNPLPSVEIDLADRLDVTTPKLFDREFKKKMKDTPTCFERPTSMTVPRSETGAFALWNLAST